MLLQSQPIRRKKTFREGGLKETGAKIACMFQTVDELEEDTTIHLCIHLVSQVGLFSWLENCVVPFQVL